jgi:hypothetical protein
MTKTKKKMAKKKDNDSPLIALLKKRKCCGVSMSMYEFYSQGTDSNTAVCKLCGNYVKVETGQLDEEEVEGLDEDDDG